VRKFLEIVLFGICSFSVIAGPQEPNLGAQQLLRYTGDFWEANEAFAAEVRVIDGKLWAVHSPTRRNELVPAGPDRFEMIGLPAKVFVEYTMNASGVVEIRRTIDGEERGRFTPFVRREPTAEELAQYAGVYEAPEDASRYTLTAESDALRFHSDNTGSGELNALFGEVFENPEVGSFIFERNAEGAVTRFVLRARNAPGRLFEKL